MARVNLVEVFRLLHDREHTVHNFAHHFHTRFTWKVTMMSCLGKAMQVKRSKSRLTLSTMSFKCTGSVSPDLVSRPVSKTKISRYPQLQNQIWKHHVHHHLMHFRKRNKTYWANWMTCRDTLKRMGLLNRRNKLSNKKTRLVSSSRVIVAMISHQ